MSTKRHVKVGNIAIQCTDCLRCFINRIMTDKHLKHICPLCRTKTCLDLKQHMQAQHIRCPLCQLWFKDEQILQKHKDLRQLPLKECQLCPSKRVYCDMKTHLQMRHQHLPELKNKQQTFKCDMIKCKFTSSSKRSIKEHKNTVHFCSGCDTYIANMKKHYHQPSKKIYKWITKKCEVHKNPTRRSIIKSCQKCRIFPM